MSLSCALISDPYAMQRCSLKWKAEGKTIGLVTTMGCLHEGHISLVKEARRKADRVVVSIFVNPLQFAPNEDFAVYPRPFERDVELCKEAGADVIFCPKMSDIYPRGSSIRLEGGWLAKQYCGWSRPTFFNGVLTVVSILFQIVQPTFSIFGEKDFQQLHFIKRMCKDGFVPVEVIGMPTIREPSGLAMSSRNTYLSPEQKERAASIYKSMCELRDTVRAGHTDVQALLSKLKNCLKTQEDIQLDYACLVDLKTMEPLGDNLTGPARLLVAAYMGKSPRIRLIDNILV